MGARTSRPDQGTGGWGGRVPASAAARAPGHDHETRVGCAAQHQGPPGHTTPQPAAPKLMPVSIARNMGRGDVTTLEAAREGRGGPEVAGWALTCAAVRCWCVWHGAPGAQRNGLPSWAATATAGWGQIFLPTVVPSSHPCQPCSRSPRIGPSSQVHSAHAVSLCNTSIYINIIYSNNSNTKKKLGVAAGSKCQRENAR